MAVTVGDTVEIHWSEGDRRDTATVEKVLAFCVRLRIPASRETTITIPLDTLREAGQARWDLDL